jgi:hypothetical protein
MNEPDAGRYFLEALQIRDLQVSRARRHRRDRYQVDVAAAVPATPTAREFARALDEAHDAQAEAQSKPDPDEGSGLAPATTIAHEFARALEEALDAEPAADAETGPEPTEEPAPTAKSTPGNQFAQLIRRRLDPANSAATGPAVTTEQSRWITDTCPVCRHSFRQGDRVWLDDRDGRITPVHDSPELSCHSGGDAGEPPAPAPTPTAAAAAFAEELRLTYPRLPGLVVKRLKPGHWLLDGQYRTRARCAGCNHTFRPWDRVAFCPCSPATRDCELAAHRDPVASLLCFDALADPERKHCPRDYHKLGERPDAGALCPPRADPRLGPKAAARRFDRALRHRRPRHRSSPAAGPGRGRRADAVRRGHSRGIEPQPWRAVRPR